MQDLLHAALHALNLPYTFLLGVVFVYWLSVLFGAIDLGSFDVDVDMDLDAEADVSIGGWFAGALQFFHLDRLPFMLIMSLVILAGWGMTVLSNHYWGDYRLGFALAMAAPILLTAFMVAKVLSYPLLPVFAATNQEAKPVEYIGKVARIKLRPTDTHFGQAGVDNDGDQLLINIKSTVPTGVLSVGQDVLIIGQTQDKRYWLVRPLAPNE
ncbi:MAG: hypothetical protein AAGJ82_04720 [Bacteroidota bacterium]